MTWDWEITFLRIRVTLELVAITALVILAVWGIVSDTPATFQELALLACLVAILWTAYRIVTAVYWIGDQLDYQRSEIVQSLGENARAVRDEIGSLHKSVRELEKLYRIEAEISGFSTKQLKDYLNTKYEFSRSDWKESVLSSHQEKGLRAASFRILDHPSVY